MTGEPTWFDDEGRMSLEAPEDTVVAGMTQRMVEAEVQAQHRTTIVEGDFTPRTGPIAQHEVAGALDRRVTLYDSARTGCYLLPHRDCEVFIEATRQAYRAIVDGNLTLSKALASGQLPARILGEMPASSRIGLVLVAAGHGWSPMLLAKHLVMEDAIRSGDERASETNPADQL